MVLIGLSIVVALFTQFGHDEQSVFYHGLTFVDVRHRLEHGFRLDANGLYDIRRGELWRRYHAHLLTFRPGTPRVQHVVARHTGQPD